MLVVSEAELRAKGTAAHDDAEVATCGAAIFRLTVGLLRLRLFALRRALTIVYPSQGPVLCAHVR